MEDQKVSLHHDLVTQHGSPFHELDDACHCMSVLGNNDVSCYAMQTTCTKRSLSHCSGTKDQQNYEGHHTYTSHRDLVLVSGTVESPADIHQG